MNTYKCLVHTSYCIVLSIYDCKYVILMAAGYVFIDFTLCRNYMVTNNIMIIILPSSGNTAYCNNTKKLQFINSIYRNLIIYLSKCNVVISFIFILNVKLVVSPKQ